MLPLRFLFGVSNRAVFTQLRLLLPRRQRCGGALLQNVRQTLLSEDGQRALKSDGRWWRLKPALAQSWHTARMGC
jgi:hypothetical protein